MKFCGITYSGLTKTIRASTRAGATLEFTIKDQFLAFLLEARESILNKRAIKYGGSTAHLNTRESIGDVSVKSWVESELSKFLSLEHPQSLLFKGR